MSRKPFSRQDSAFLKPVPAVTGCMLTNRRQEVIISDENGRMAKEGATALFCLFVCVKPRAAL